MANGAVRLTGEAVTISSVSRGTLGHGEFRLENGTDQEITAAIESAWIEVGEERTELTGVTLFDRLEERSVDPGGFPVPAGAVKTYILGFPAIPEPRLGEPIAVGLRLRTGESVLEARSSIRVERRIPRTR